MHLRNQLHVIAEAADQLHELLKQLQQNPQCEPLLEAVANATPLNLRYRALASLRAGLRAHTLAALAAKQDFRMLTEFLDQHQAQTTTAAAPTPENN